VIGEVTTLEMNYTNLNAHKCRTMDVQFSAVFKNIKNYTQIEFVTISRVQSLKKAMSTPSSAAQRPNVNSKRALFVCTWVFK
jgi:hypothetical protein